MPNNSNVVYAVETPGADITITLKATNGRDARSKVLSLFKSVTGNNKLKRDDLSSTRVTLQPVIGRSKTNK